MLKGDQLNFGRSQDVLNVFVMTVWYFRIYYALCVKIARHTLLELYLQSFYFNKKIWYWCELCFYLVKGFASRAGGIIVFANQASAFLEGLLMYRVTCYWWSEAEYVWWISSREYWWFLSRKFWFTTISIITNHAFVSFHFNVLVAECFTFFNEHNRSFIVPFKFSFFM